MIGRHKKHLVVKPLIFGILGSLSLLSVYFIILTAANSFNHAIEQFMLIWYWIVMLVIGFGIQVGLFMYIKGVSKVRAMTGMAASTMAAAGGVSTGSMIACCAHHLADVLPFIGLSAAAVFLNRYQVLFMVAGVLSNLIGINLMLKIIQEHKLYGTEGGLKKILKLDMKKTLYYNFGFSAVVFLITLFSLIGG